MTIEPLSSIAPPPPSGATAAAPVAIRAAGPPTDSIASAAEGVSSHWLIDICIRIWEQIVWALKELWQFIVCFLWSDSYSLPPSTLLGFLSSATEPGTHDQLVAVSFSTLSQEDQNKIKRAIYKVAQVDPVQHPTFAERCVTQESFNRLLVKNAAFRVRAYDSLFALQNALQEQPPQEEDVRQAFNGVPKIVREHMATQLRAPSASSAASSPTDCFSQWNTPAFAEQVQVALNAYLY